MPSSFLSSYAVSSLTCQTLSNDNINDTQLNIWQNTSIKSGITVRVCTFKINTSTKITQKLSIVHKLNIIREVL